MTEPTWQIIIPTIPHRAAKFAMLMNHLNKQYRLGMWVTAYHDNLEATYCQKLQRLMDATTADYVSVLSDDDWVADDFVPAVLLAMRDRPDQIGFRVRYTCGGQLMMPVIHSLACGGWYERTDEIGRDIMYYNPVRRELVQDVAFRGDGCDREWSDDLRARGTIQSEVFIDREMHYYQWDPADQFFKRKSPLPADQIPPKPDYPWLTYIGG